MALGGSFTLMRSALGTYRNSLCNRCALPVYQQNATFKQSIEEKLGLPIKPKKPLTPYFRFVAQMRPKLLQSIPQAKVTEIVQIAAKKWAEVDSATRQKLESEYKQEMVEYTKTRLKYDESLTDEQREEVKRAKYDQVETKEKKTLKKKMKELGKPRKPLTGFLQYMNGKLKLRGEVPFKEWQVKVAQEWENLQEIEKTHINEQAKRDMETYKRELRGWEEKMIRLGHIDVVRNEALIQPKSKPRPKRLSVDE